MDELVASASGVIDGALSIPLSTQQVWDEVTANIQGHFQRSFSLQTMRDLSLLQQYSQQLLKNGDYKMKKIEASKLVARSNHRETDGTYLARYIRSLFQHFQLHGSIPLEMRGGKREGASYLDNEDIFGACREWLMAQEIGSVSTETFATALNRHLLPRLKVNPTKPLGMKTAYRWLLRLGFSASAEQKGVYVDGHERPDVLEYRDTVFLPRIAALQAKTIQYHEVDGILYVTPPVLSEGEKRHIIYFHDESCFHAFDFKKRIWLDSTQQKVPRKGGQGRLIHVSDFISTEGRIVLKNQDGTIIEDARKIIFPGKNGDPWWDTKQLLQQLDSAITLHEKIQPDIIAVFVFDQSSAHNSHGDGALSAFDMNLTCGGAKAPQNATIFPPFCGSIAGQAQQLSYFESPTGKLRPKGIKLILEERRCYPDLSIPIFEGKAPKAKCQPRCPDPVADPLFVMDFDLDTKPCCLARILQNHPDFRAQKSAIEQLIVDRGHKCLFLPKFHCELNAIEMYWGYSKALFRQVTKATFKDGQREVIIALDSCKLDTMRRFCNRSYRFMDAYKQGLSIKAAAWCVRKQKGHRAISEEVMQEFDSVYNTQK